METCRGLLATNRKRASVFISFVILNIAVLHVIYNGYWRPSISRSLSLDLLAFWKESPNRPALDYEALALQIHIDRPVLGDDSVRLNTVAIGSGLTSKRLNGINETNIASKFQLFFTFIPTFCETADPDFNYHFYFSYDSVDRTFNNETFLKAFRVTFLNATRTLCPDKMRTRIHMVRCNHAGKPAWAQNDAMLEAYLDNVEYYYRINDDTKMITKNWTKMFIEVLRNYKPTNVGVVGPNHSGGNKNILTYDFVHRSHVDVFGFYYPRLFTDWYADNWITNVYEPHRSTKLSNVRLAHTLGLGQRYGVNGGVRKKLKGQLDRDHLILKRYINYTSSKDSIKVDGRKVISMSLYRSDPKYTWGAIRNAQIAPIFFPGWKLRFYLTSRSSKAADVKSWLVPKRIVNKLKQLGAEIAYVKTKSIAPVFWRYLVIDDQTVDYFIVRDTDSRLSYRDAAAVNDWLQHQDLKSDLNSLHCIRDHPDHANRSIVDGLWGGNRAMVRDRLGRDMSSLLLDISDGNRFRNRTKDSGHQTVDKLNVLKDRLWCALASRSLCHDSVSCNSRQNVRRFPLKRESDEIVGQRFDEHQEPIFKGNKRIDFNLTENCEDVNNND